MPGAHENSPHHRVRQALEHHHRVKQKLRETAAQVRDQQEQARQALGQVIADETHQAPPPDGGSGQAA